MMKAYPEYKESKFNWFGDVPKHWQLKKVAWDMPFLVGWTPSTSEAEYFQGDNIWVSIEDMKEKWLSSSKKQISEKAIKDKGISCVPKGSLLFSFKLSVGKVAFADADLYTNEAIASFVENESVSLRFLYYAAPLFLPRFGQENIYGALLMNQERIQSAKTFMPNFDEQLAIAEFLDSETLKIDNLIAEKESFIKLLQEKRQALISHVVTKGLDDNVKMKPSGVEWIGDIPEHWEISKLKFLSKTISKGSTPTTGGDEFQDEGVRFLKAENIGKSEFVNLTPSFFISEETHQNLARSSLEANDITIIIAGATIGRSSIVQPEAIPCNTNQAVSFIRLKNEENAYFVNSWLGCNETQNAIMVDTVQSAMPNLSMTDLGNIPIPLPNQQEINLITQYLKREKSKFQRIIDETNKSIELLKEHRTALISAAVTGKIDVREAV